MSDTAAYPGSPSLSPEAREKVLQTFRHTLELAKSGRNDEALLGCDFILKMDSRFTPARKLLEMLRGVAAGTIIDTSAFLQYVTPSAKPTASVPQGSTVLSPVRPPKPAAPQPAPQASEPIGFDFGGGTPMGAPQAAQAAPPAGPDPFAAAAAAAPAFGPDPFARPTHAGPSAHGGQPAAPAFPDFGAPPEAPDPFATVAPATGFSFGPTPVSAPDPFAAPGAPGDFGSFGAPSPAQPAGFGAFGTPGPVSGGDPFATSALPAAGFGSFGPQAAPPPPPDFGAPPPDFGSFGSAPAPGDIGGFGFPAPPAFPEPSASPFGGAPAGAPADPFAAFGGGAPSAPPADPFAAFGGGAPSAPTADPFAAFGGGAPSAPPADPFAAFGGGAPSAPPADPFAAFGGGAPSAPPADPFAAFGGGAPSAPPADPFAAFGGGAPSAPPADPFAAFGGGAPSAPPADPFAAFGGGAPSAPPADPFAAFGGGAPSAPPAGPSGVDPRIVQFLRQGDDAMARGQVQEAIDLWSRVFLIDLSNEDASRRIDQARERLAQSAQQVDMLVSEGMQLFDRGELAAARGKFLEVLTISENDSTARSYLAQIDASMAGAGGGMPASSAQGGYQSAQESSYEEPEPLFVPAAEGLDLEEQGAPVKAAPAKKGMKLDPKILIGVGVLLVAAIAGGLYFFTGAKPAPAPPPPVETKKGPVQPVGEDLVGKAQSLFDQGRVDEALQILVGIPDSDPRHAEALAMIDRFKTTAIPTPAAAGASVDYDQLKAQGLASIKASRYIDAVRALDPVVKARPEDSEAALALAKAREEISALGAALKAYNDQDYSTAVKLLYPIYAKDKKNQDAEEFLFRSFFNDGIQKMQAGSFKDATESFLDATKLRPSDQEAQRHLRFTKKYQNGPEDLLSRIYVKHSAPRL